MTKNTAAALLVILNIAVTLLGGAAIMLLFYSFGFFAAALFGIGYFIWQIRQSVYVYNRFGRRYGISAKQYVLYAALPSAVLSVLGIVVMFIIESNYIVLPGTICALGLTVYSAAYLIELRWRLAELPRADIADTRKVAPDE